MEITGYSLLSIIYEGTHTRIFRAVRDKDSAAVIIKLLYDLNPSLDVLVNFKHEYYVLESIKDLSCVPTVYELNKNNGYWFIVEADIDGQSLDQIIKKQRFDLLSFLKLAIKIVQALHEIHTRGLIHKDINPHNIICNPQERIQIIDFSLSSDLALEEQSSQKEKTLRGTLKYISPEQTGRMNRSIDYRTDFYSLGLTFYTMLSGQLPFSSEDPIELIYQHLTQTPLSLHEFDKSIPLPISNIVQRLIEKTAENRYQTTYGIIYDLEQCLTSLENTGEISAFELGQKDTSNKFNIPQKLYGREEAVNTLLKSFENLKIHNQSVIAIAGEPGIGKSFLIQELYKPITKLHSYFFRGKFDEYERNIQLIGLARLLRDFTQQVLTESNEDVLRWKERIQHAVGINGKVLIDILPELETIIGPQANLLAVEPQAAEKRFIITIQNFFKIFDDNPQPVAIFMDDMQWADSLTLKCMLACIQITNNILYIFSYRSNEISQVHPFALFLEEVAEQTAIKLITLSPLSLECIEQLLADTFPNNEHIKILARVLLDKTQGNPFYIRLFLQDMYKKQLIQFNYKKQKWDIAVENIHQVEITQNVLESLLSYLLKLPTEVHSVLSAAACVGNTFSLSTVSQLFGKPQSEVAPYVKIALADNYIVPLDNNYRFSIETDNYDSSYAFSHDKIREAAYSLLSEEEAKQYHYKLGVNLINNVENIEHAIVVIVDHLNKAGELVQGDLRNKLKKLNLLAAKKSRESQAYQQALGYAESGILLLSESDWEQEYETSLGLYLEAAEMSGHLAENTKSQEYSHIARQHAKSTLDIVRIYYLNMFLQIANSHPQEAIAVGLDALGELGYPLPAHPKPWQILLAIVRANRASKKVPLTEIVKLPNMEDKRIRAITFILHNMLTSAVQVRPKLFVVILSNLFRLNITYGLSDTSPLAFVSYGILSAGIFQDFQKAHAYGSLGYNLGFRFKTSLPLTGPGFCGFINHTVNPYRNNLPILKNCYDVSIETGNTEFALLSLVAQAVIHFLTGDRLIEVNTRIQRTIAYAKQLKQEFIIRYILVHAQALQNLLHKDSELSHLKGEFYDEDSQLPLHQKQKDFIAFIFSYFLKIYLAYLMGDYALGYHYLKISRKYVKRLLSHLYAPLFIFYDILTTIQYYPCLNWIEKLSARRQLKRNFKKLKKYAMSSPNNYADKYHLALAELNRLNRNFESASHHFEEALKVAKQNNYTNMESLINERAANFYFEANLDHIGNMYLLEAYIGYLQWGSPAKINQLEEAYPWLLDSASRQQKSTVLTLTESTSTQSEAQIDYFSAIKASNTVANEISLPALITSLFHILTENIAAQRCVLLLSNFEQLFMEGDYTIEDGMHNLLESIPINKNSKALPFSVVQYVFNTQESLLIDNMSDMTQFTKDAYIQTQQPKSILCSPLLYQTHIIGVLYFESNIDHAFTRDRLEFLNLLSSQIAISINNAKLYRSLNRFVPHQFLNLLGKSDLLDVKLGNSTQKVLTILFADIRGFTTFSEKNEASEVFSTLNLFLSQIEPIISNHNGFIDKYIGDAIMALFPDDANDAVKAAIAIQRQLELFNQENHTNFRFGIGINTGPVMIGTLGSENRMDGTVISDTVNTASRIENLTKVYNIMLLISDETKSRLSENTFHFRYVEAVALRGKSNKTILWEILDILPANQLSKRLNNLATYNQAIEFWQHGELKKAQDLFEQCLQSDPEDCLIKWYLKLPY